jgi:hypothetical protein
MANTNTPYIAKASAPLGNATAATVFTVAPNPLALIAANQTPQAAWVKFHGWAANTAANSGASNQQNTVTLKVRAAGRVVGGTTTNFTPTIQLGRSTTAGSNTNVASLTAAAFNTASGNFYMEALLVLDPVSGQINGTFEGFAGSGGTQTTTARAAITPITGQAWAAPATSVTGAFATGETVLYFSVAGLFSASNAGNTAFLDTFQVETI